VSARRIETIPELRLAVAEARPLGPIGLVPTMGALHAGHAELIRRASQECGFVVASIFVNPTQFDRTEDFQRYPRTLAADLEFCAAHGAAVVFAPDAAEMYPGPPLTFVEAPTLAEKLCGEFRPGHFRGVATVVAKLFNIVQPDRAYFGEKDAQQLAIIRQMTADLDFPIVIVPIPTVREPDGLAMSSRNRLLSPAERRIAPALYQALLAARSRVAAGATSAAEVREAALAALAPHKAVRVEYLEIVDPALMRPVERIAAPVLAAAAVWLGAVRLIDNVFCEPPRH